VVADGRGTVVIWIVAAVVGVVALMRLSASGDDPAAGERVRVDRTPAAPAGAGPAKGGHEGVFVHVAGAVRRPGLVRVPAGARVAAAVARAGGPTRKADLTGVNLAAQLEDGQQVVVPVAGAVAPEGDSSGMVTAPGAKPSIGTATAEQLDEIDGIGPTLAERIVEYRTENGGFGSLDELQDVDGIGEKRFEALREALQP
jgi:competence protein ComEA